MALIQFITGGGGTYTINNLSGSGLGFYGSAGFGASVPVGTYQGRTFVTDSTGTNQGPETWNNQWLNQASGIIGQVGTGIILTGIPNFQATLNIQFTNATAVKTQNAKVQIYDRFAITNPASGVTTRLAEIVHPSLTQVNNGSGSTVWTVASGVASATGIALLLTASPGTSGFRPNGASTTDTEHDWYIAISASPDTIGAKTQYGLYCYIEYL